jgi:hypothetical protein
MTMVSKHGWYMLGTSALSWLVAAIVLFLVTSSSRPDPFGYTALAFVLLAIIFVPVSFVLLPVIWGAFYSSPQREAVTVVAGAISGGLLMILFRWHSIKLYETFPTAAAGLAAGAVFAFALHRLGPERPMDEFRRARAGLYICAMTLFGVYAADVLLKFLR